MQTSAACLQGDELRSFIAGKLVDQRKVEIESHLSTCEACRAALENTVGDDDWWNDVSMALRALSSPKHKAALLDDTDFEDNDQQRAFENERLTGLLGPTDDPNMMGRIGSYEIVGILGQGGMGAVFKAFDAGLHRYVAIKVLLPHLASSGAARARFRREGQAAAAVIDDHVLPIYAVDQWQGTPYLVMQYMRGVTLQKRIHDQGPLELREILRIGMHAACGLAAAHAQGLVHRDVKPSNILLDSTVARSMLTDFGLARAVDDATLTTSGMLAGTPQYMSPEQARAETVDHRSDLFSLGSVLHTMCTGRAPFRAETSYGVLRRITDEEPTAIREINPDVPEWLCAIIRKLMSKQVDDRFQSAEEVAEVLQRCLAHSQHPLEHDLPMIDTTPIDTVPIDAAPTTDFSQWTDCLFSSPEHVRSPAGRFLWNYTGRGKARMTGDAIELNAGGVNEVIPFSSIEEVSIGHYSRFTHPIRMDYLRVRYRDGEDIETRLLTPGASLLSLVWSGNATVKQWAKRLSKTVGNVEDIPPKSNLPTLLIAAAAFFLLVFAGVFLVLELSKGTLTIESEADDVPIRIMQGNEVVEELTVSKAGMSTRISAGKYVVELGDDFDGAVVDGGIVTLKRGGLVKAKITLSDKDEKLLSAKRGISQTAAGLNAAPDIANGTILPGDTIAVFIPAILPGRVKGKTTISPPVTKLPNGETVTGYPLRVVGDGTLRLPMLDPISIKGMSVREAEQAILEAYVDNDILREDKGSVMLTRIAEKDPLLDTLIQPGATIAIYLPGILPSDSNMPPPVSRLSSGDVVSGFPLVVAADGTLKLPYVEPIKIAGQTIREAESTIAKAFIKADVLRKERAFPILSLVNGNAPQGQDSKASSGGASSAKDDRQVVP